MQYFPQPVMMLDKYTCRITCVPQAFYACKPTHDSHIRTCTYMQIEFVIYVYMYVCIYVCIIPSIQRFWEVAGSKMGTITGLTTDEAQVAAEAQEAKKVSDEDLFLHSSKHCSVRSFICPFRKLSPSSSRSILLCLDERSFFTSVHTRTRASRCQVEDDSEDHDYKQDSQFMTHLKKSEAQSDFSKRLTIQEQRRFLPVYDIREELLNVIRDNQVRCGLASVCLVRQV